MPSFTVVVPARNREHLVARAVASAWAQTWPPERVVVVDDASTDGTVAAARAAGAEVVELASAGGSGPARNAGVERATTEWIAFLDSDDEWDPGHLADLAQWTGGRVLVGCAARTPSGTVRGWAGEEPLELTPRLVLSALNQLLCTSGTAVERDALLRAGGFRALPRAQDFDCWLRVLEQGSGIATGHRTVVYHEHPGQVSLAGDLNRTCVLRILGDAARRPWADPRLIADAYARFFVDDVRTGVRNRQADRIAKSLAGLVVRRRVWPGVGRLAMTALRSRLAVRRGTTAPAG